MDVDAVLARRPKVALVDELAHTNVPGSRNAKRWQDIEELLGGRHRRHHHRQHPAPGVGQRRRREDHRRPAAGDGPDAVVRAADQIELEDMTAEALRRRLAHGNVYAPEKVDAALSNYFRAGNLNALRELALLWTADRVDDALQQYREKHDITGTWEARERVVVALTGGPEGETLIRRAARIAARSSGGDLLAVHVARSDGLVRRQPGRAGRATTPRRVARRHLPPGARRRRARTPCSPSPAPRTPPSSCSATAAVPRWARLFSPGTASAHRAASPATSTSTSSPTPTPAAGCRCRTAAAASARRRKLRGYALARRAAAAADAGADAVPRRAEPGQRHAALPPADRRRGARRRPVPRP